MSKNKKKQLIHKNELLIENYNKKNIINSYSILYSNIISYSPRLESLRKDTLYSLPSINHFLNIEDSDEEEHKVHKVHKQHKQEEEEEEEEEKNQLSVSRMLFIPLKSENQRSLSQSSSENESIQSFESYKIIKTNKKRNNQSNYLMKRKVSRQPLSTLTNQSFSPSSPPSPPSTSSTTTTTTTTTTTKRKSTTIDKSIKSKLSEI